MQTQTASDFKLLQFQYLPRYANYLLTERLQDFSLHQLELAREYNVPLLKLFAGFSEQEIKAINQQGVKDFLTYLANNDAKKQIELAVKRWIDNQLPQVDKYSVQAEDITLIAFIRKKGFLNFLKSYTQDIDLLIELVKEIDLFTLASETASTNTYISLLHKHIDEQLHLIQKITNTSPAIIYVFNVKTLSLQFANQPSEEFSGLTNAELTSLGKNVLQEIMFPDDMKMAHQFITNISDLKDGVVKQIEHRLRNKEGKYKWMRNYISIFKRGTKGEIEEIIGILQDINDEKMAQQKLKEREQQLLEAQDIGQIGSYIWDIKNANESTGTPKTKEILEIEINDREGFFNNIHPADRKKVNDAIQLAMKTGKLECEYRYNGKGKEKIIWSRGIVTYDNGKPACISGTLMDVTERHHMVEELKQSQERFKQAEAITHLGSYERTPAGDEIIWSDELYRIFGMEPKQEKITPEKLRDFFTADEAKSIAEIIEKGLQSKKPYEYYGRILLKDGQRKILHIREVPILDEQNNINRIVGTAMDVTEKQTLIQKLRRSENNYKQAEALANIGNYLVDIQTGEVEWTDQLYIIYDLEPQSEKITNERFLSFIHPEDKERVLKTIDQFYITGSTEYIFRIITGKGVIKTLHTIAQLQRDEQGKAVYVVGTDQDVTEQQNLIQQFEESERLYKEAQTIAKLGNWRYMIATGKTIWSDEMYNIYEVDKNEPINLDWIISFIHPDEREETVAYFHKCIKEKQPYDRRHRIVLRNGKIKTIHRKAELKVDENGNAVEMFGTSQDITEQQAFENELKEKQNFIEKITNATPSIIGVYNVNTGTYDFITEGLNKLLGYDTKEALEKGAEFFNSIVHPEDLPIVSQKNKSLIHEYNNQQQENNDIVIEFSYRARHKKGQYRWLQTYATLFDRNGQGKIEHMLNITLDITSQIEASNKIKEQEYFINHIADASPTILYLYDVSRSCFIYINKEIYYVLGYTIDEIINAGSNITENLYHPDDIDLLPERKNSSKSFHHKDSMIQYECRMKSKKGEWCWVLVREVVFKRDEDGKVLQILGSALDISKRKEMEKTLLQNSILLEQSNASLEEFAYVASHDLKEPLRKISTFGDRLINTQLEKLSDDGKVYLKKIVDASQRMQTMITDLLSISMITGDRSFQPYSLQAVLADVLQTLEFKIEQKNAIIKSDPLPEANIVPSQFRQLFQNLISNSLKFVKDDVQPVITIKHSIVEPGEVEHLQLAKAPQYHKLEFKDNGIGFEEEYAGRIFAIFQRLHGRSEYEGTGIGLAICKKIIEHHGGAIYATGTPDEGATFTIILPA